MREGSGRKAGVHTVLHLCVHIRRHFIVYRWWIKCLQVVVEDNKHNNDLTGDGKRPLPWFAIINILKRNYVGIPRWQLAKFLDFRPFHSEYNPIDYNLDAFLITLIRSIIPSCWNGNPAFYGPEAKQAAVPLAAIQLSKSAVWSPATIYTSRLPASVTTLSRVYTTTDVWPGRCIASPTASLAATTEATARDEEEGLEEDPI